MGKLSGVWVIVGLAAGIAGGAAVDAYGDASLTDAARLVQAVGGLWLNALRMTVAPLVAALLVTGVASIADAAASGRTAVRALTAFAVLLVIAGVYVALAAPAALAFWPLDPAAAAALLKGASGAVAAGAPPPPPAQGLDVATFIRSLAPTNAIAAAANDAIVPLVTFSLALGFASTRLPSAQRDLLANLFRAISEAMIVIVQWVLLVAPVGVFALGLGVGLDAGLKAAGVLLQYVVIVSGVTLGSVGIAFLAAIFWAHVPVLRFLSAVTPVIGLAISTQSSLACLPAMVERTRDRLKAPESVVDLALPLAVAVFRITSPVANLSVVFFIAHAAGLHLDPATIAVGVLVALAVSVGAVGLPGQVSFYASIAPICLAMGVPTGPLGVLIAVEVIPDIFRTVGNVVAHMAATVIAGRGARPAPPATA